MAKLNVSNVKNAKYESKPIKLTDGGGLYLYVNKSGKYWRYDYRFLNKRKTLSIGTFPEVSLSMARQKHFDARRQLADGIDPAHEKRVNKFETMGVPENCFSKFAWEWFERQLRRWTHGHSRTVKSRLEQNVIPWLGERSVDKITPKDVLEICRRVENRGAYETAHRVKSICSQVFRYCVALGVCDSDPCRDLTNALIPAVPRHMATITDPKRVGELMRAIEGYEGYNVARLGLRLAPLVFVRPGEMRNAEWSEFDFDQAMWKISAHKMMRWSIKNGHFS